MSSSDFSRSGFGASPSDFDESPVDADRFMASMARFLIEGDEREEARLLLACTLKSWHNVERHEYDPASDELVLCFEGPRKVYDLLRDFSSNLYKALHHAAEAFMPSGYDYPVVIARAAAVEPNSADWRNELLAILDGRDVDNQAIGFKATRTYEGLRFRSESEVRIAQALDRASVMYVPNCRARIGSTDRRRNVEADFLVMVDGKWGVLEVDGEQWHAGLASRDHERDRPFHFHGAYKVQRFDAGECFENPDAVVKQFVTASRGAVVSDNIDFEQDFSQFDPVTVTFTAAEAVALFKYIHPMQKNPDPSEFFSVIKKLDGALTAIKLESARRDAS